MVSDQNYTPPQTTFPTPTESVSFGFRFFKDNLWLYLIFGGLAAAASGASGVVVERSADNTGAIVLAGLVALVLAFFAALFRLVVIRRTLDYWEETRGDVPARPFAEAVNTAVEGAQPRTLPYIGWALLWAVVFTAAIMAAFAIAFAFDGNISLVILFVELVVILVALLLSNFLLVATADGPGNPMARSFHVFKGHTMRVFGTYLLYFLMVFAVSFLIAILVLILGDSSFAEAIGTVLAGVLGFVIGGATVGSDTIMYRAVYPPGSAA